MLGRLVRFFAVLACIAAAAYAALQPASNVAAAARPSPSPSPTPQPTPYMALEDIPNGTWEIIMQGAQINYSTMKLTDVGTAISGVWLANKKTTYAISGTRDGSRLKLQIKLPGKSDAAPVGKIDATIDGIADMFGTITLGTIETPFQGAQHSRVPVPVETGPAPSPSPF